MSKKHKEQTFKFSSKKYKCFFDASFEDHIHGDNIVIITDENIVRIYAEKFSPYKMIVIPAGEKYKQQSTADKVIYDLINLKADKETFIVGVGGGVVTDIAGYVASIYMRGVQFALVPTSILAMVDASVGGKNGVDVGVYKNLVGTIRHPEMLIYDYSFLKTLTQEEWINGFAEIIKHACIKDADMFEELETHSLEFYQSSPKALSALIQKNVEIKYNVVSNDELEKGERKLLNFGHTIGHAIENLHHLPHGHAISIGMIAACRISQIISGFSHSHTILVEDLLIKYALPVKIDADKERVWEILLMDKKRAGGSMNFVLLDKIGKGKIQLIKLEELKIFFDQIFQ
ncbi:3-dehydroquinate synthase [soil metagenome]